MRAFGVFYRLASGTGRGTVGDMGQWLIDSVPDHDPEIVREMDRLNQINHDRTSAAEAYSRENAVHWDRVRSIYVDEATIEKKLLELAPGPVREHLDLGTGAGRILELFDERADRGLGIDLSHEMLSVAREKLARSPQARRLSVRHGDISQLPLKDASFDLVTLHQVLHYVADPEGVLAEASRVMEPGGTLPLSISLLTIWRSCESNTPFAGWGSRIGKWPIGCATPAWKPMRLFTCRAIP